MPIINYDIEQNKATGPLVIRDRCNERGGMSVTNGAEAVVEELYRSGLLTTGRRLFYFDTEGQLDELVHEAGKFVRFAPGEGVIFQ